MPKNKHIYGVACKPIHKSRNQHYHGNYLSTKLPSRSGLVKFLSFQLFICLVLLTVSGKVWAADVALSVFDTKGEDTVFNGEDEQLRINVRVTGQAVYALTVTADGKVIHRLDILEADGTVSLDWNGEGFPDGTYTIRAEIRWAGGGGNVLDSEETSVRLDRTPPQLSIGTDMTAFSPNRDGILERLNVYYGINEDVKESWLAFENATGVGFGRVELRTDDGDHRYPWNGGNRSMGVFPDGIYTLKFYATDKGGNEASPASIQVTIDTKAPNFAKVERGPDKPLANGSAIKESIQEISATLSAGGGTPIDFDSDQTEITLKGERGVTIDGDSVYDAEAAKITFTLGNPLDTISENGKYRFFIAIADKAGNTAEKRIAFTFDNVPPNLTAAATSKGPLTPGSGVSKWMNFVEATLTDNLEDGINLSDSTIRLTGPNGAVLGRQTQPSDDSIRWIFLSPLLAKDGLMDGEYIIEVVGTDKAGNQTETIRVPFIYDNLAPKLVALSSVQGSEAFTPIGDTIYYNLPLTQLIATFSDGDVGIGIDFSQPRRQPAPTHIVFGTPKAEGGVNPLAGRAFPDEENSLFMYVLDAPIDSRDGSQDGTYTLSVTAADTLGNTQTDLFQLVYDTQLPTLVSTLPAANQTVSNLSQIEVKLNEITSGIDFIQSNFRLLNGAAEEVPVNITSNGADTATLTLLQPIALDGSDDGTYTIEVTPTDLAGNTGATARREFFLVSQSHQPEVRLTMPDTSTVNDFTTVVAELINYTGAGIDVDASTLTVTNPQGVLIPAAEVEPDEANNLLTWRTEVVVARDGSADGEYTITATFVDFTGKRFVQEFPILLDTQFPAIKNVQVATEAQTQLSMDSITYIAETFPQITVAFDETANDINFGGTVVSLAGPDEADIPLNRLDDGQNVLTLSFPTLTQPGEYVLSITPQDLAGNQSTAPFVYRFRIDVPLPIVSSVRIDGKSGTIVYVNGAAASIVATFADLSGVGLALGDGGSTIAVTNESGLPAPGITTSNGTNQLTWIPIVLPTDGSADGRYTVVVTPKDKAGRQGDVVYRQFVYDTQKPRVTAAAPLTLSQPVSYISGVLTQFQFTLEDVGPAGLALEEQTIALLDSGGTPVAATLTADPQNPTDATAFTLYLTLSSPLAQDGSADGEYTVKLGILDKSSNHLDSEHAFIYDSQVPQLSSVTVDTEPPVALLPQRITELSEPISSITLEFEDATQMDFANTVITLMGPDASGESEALPIPLTLKDDGASQLTVSFLELTQIGSYTLAVTPQDIAGNAASGALNYRFFLDVPLPSVSSVIIGEQTDDVVYVNASNMRIGALLLDPTETGLAFGSEGSSITVTTPEGTVVPGATGSNGEDLIVWEPITLTSDGTTDGRYNVYVTPIDQAGRQGSTIYREFVYDTQEPEIIASAPIDLSQPVSYISESLTQFRFTVADVGPAELMLSDQKVSLHDASGSLVQTHLTNDTQSQLFLTPEPFPLDGSMDGEYTVVVALSDKAGNAFNVEHLIVYDTQTPSLVSTVPADGDLLTEDVTQIQVTLNDEGGSGIDWEITTVTLVDPNGSEISGELVSNGTTQLILNTNQLVEDGRYIIRVQAVDRAGNGNETVSERSFLLSRRLPAIVSTSPLTAPEDEAFTGEEIEQVEVTLETDDENHLSTLRLLNAANQVIAGQQEREADRLIYNLVRPLATDGSEDDIYTIEFTPISASGRKGEVQRLTFVYDTQAPEIEPDEAIHLVVAQPEVNNSLIEIRVDLTDNQSGIDWENLDEDWLTFERLSPDATEIAGRVDGDNQGGLTFRLAVPLADNGSADGEYRITVAPKDRAGNGDEPYQKVFTYDTSAPMIDVSALLINDVSLLVDINATAYPTPVSTTNGVVIQANIFDTGLGANLAQSRIVVRNPEGAEISGNTQQNGVDTLLFKSDRLAAQGLYEVTVISVGNDSELLGFAPTDSITTEFLYETTEPTATVTSDGGATELTDEALPLEGTAADPTGIEGGRQGQGADPAAAEGARQIQASGVWLVEIVGEGPGGQPIDPVPATDDSNAEEEPWSRWSIDFLPSRSGEYDLDVRVTDNAGNYAVYDIGEYTMSVSLTFRGATFGWPNPLRLSKGDVAFFSFDVNVPLGETVELTLSIYDWGGDIVLSQTYPDVVSGQRNDQLIKWNLKNQAGTPVARGLYVFRLEAINATGNRANVVGKVLVVD